MDLHTLKHREEKIAWARCLSLHPQVSEDPRFPERFQRTHIDVSGPAAAAEMRRASDCWGGEGFGMSQRFDVKNLHSHCSSWCWILNCCINHWDSYYLFYAQRRHTNKWEGHSSPACRITVSTIFVLILQPEAAQRFGFSLVPSTMLQLSSLLCHRSVSAGDSQTSNLTHNLSECSVSTPFVS